MTSLVDKKELDGNALVYLPRYVAPNDELFDHSDAEIEHEFLSGLQRMHPTLSLADVKAVRISRVRHVFALADTGVLRPTAADRDIRPGAVFAELSTHRERHAERQ